MGLYWPWGQLSPSRRQSSRLSSLIRVFARYSFESNVSHSDYKVEVKGLEAKKLAIGRYGVYIASSTHAPSFLENRLTVPVRAGEKNYPKS